MVAPAWTVSDRASHEFAQRFYEAVLGDGLPPDEALRRLRNQHDDRALGVVALAYRVFAQPVVPSSESEEPWPAPSASS